MKRLLLAAALLLPVSSAADEAGVRAIDGDSIKLYIRLADVDAPELHGQCQYETDLAARAKLFVATAIANGKFTVVGHGFDKYGRLLANVQSVEGFDMGATLVEMGLARPWHGRGESWCGE